MRAAVVVLAVAVATVSVFVVPHSGFPLTTYAGGSAVARAADVMAGLSLLAAGLATLLFRPRVSLGVVAVLAGAAWFAPDWVGWEAAAPLVRSLAMVVAVFVPPLLLHVAVGSATGVVKALYGAAALAGVGIALVRDPFLDQDCWSNCTDNVFLVHADQTVARLLGGALLVAFLAGGLVVAAHAARRALVPAALIGATQAAYAGALLVEPSESPDDTLFATVFLARAGAVTLLAGALAWSAYAAWRRRAAVARLATDLGAAPPPGALRAALATSLRDPDVAVAYPLDASGRYIDGAGRPVAEPVATPGRAVTPILRGGRRIAVVVHARAGIGEDELVRDIGAAARLAVENERLQAELLAQLRDLRASRARIVETGDTARRALERDLHDGAQQRLLALVYELRLARSAAQSHGEDDLAAGLDGAMDEADAALEELRELAHGIHPAILTEAGLGPALWGLVDQAPIPVRLTDPTAERYAPAIESAAYVAASEAIGDASRRTATHALVRLRRSGTRLVLEIDDDGAPAGSVPLGLVDRIGAVGGRIERAGTLLRAELPCA